MYWNLSNEGTALVCGGALFVVGMLFGWGMWQRKSGEQTGKDVAREWKVYAQNQAAFAVISEEDGKPPSAAQSATQRAFGSSLIRGFKMFLIVFFGLATVSHGTLPWRRQDVEIAPIAFKPVERRTIPGFDGEEPELLIKDDGETLLLFQMFPPENERLAALVTDDFAETLALALGVDVHHEDRELFRIEGNDPVVINRLLAFFAV